MCCRAIVRGSGTSSSFSCGGVNLKVSSLGWLELVSRMNVVKDRILTKASLRAAANSEQNLVRI